MFNNTLQPINVLLIEDIPQYQIIIQHVLANTNIHLETTSKLAEGLIKAGQIPYDAVLMDLGLPDSRGLSTFITFHNHYPTLPVIVLSATEDQQLAAQAVQMGAQDYIVKGPYLINESIGKDTLCRAITYAIERQRIQESLFNAHATLEQRVVGRTAELYQANQSLANELSIRRRFEFIANASKDLLSLIDRSYCYQAVNDAYCRAQNLSHDQIEGKTVSEIWGIATFEETIHPMLAACFEGKEISQATWFNIPSLGYRFYEVYYYPFYDENHQVTHVVVDTRDETIRETARNKLSMLNSRLRILHDMDYAMAKAATPAMIFSTSLSFISSLVPFSRADLLLLSANSQAPVLISGQVGEKASFRKVPKSYAKIFTQAKLTQGLPKIVPDLHELALEKGLGYFLYEQKMLTCILTPLYSEGKLMGVLSLSSAQPDVYGIDHVEHLEAMMAQYALTLRNVQLFDELRQANTNLQQLASRLIFAQEEERRRISMELHDEAGQYLTALKLSLSMTLDQIPSGLDQARNQCLAAMDLTSATLEKLRSLAHMLRPPALDLIGLDEAIKDSCSLAARQMGIQVEYDGTTPDCLPEYIQVSIFRMVQEGLTNIVKHSGASKAEVRLENKSGSMLVEIQDNGCGFVVGSSAAHSTKGIGLVGMQERLDAVGGTLSISARPGYGTHLVAHIPIKGER